MRLGTAAMCFRLLAALVLSITVACPAIADGQANQLPAVVIVRHAERLNESDDTPLSPAGTARAQILAEALKDAGVTAIVVTNKLRTQQTAQPLATQLGITPTVVVNPDSPQHPKAVADAVRSHPGSVVLVVGHSTTVPAIISELGGSQISPTDQYSNLYLLVPGDGHMRLIQGHYGKPDP